MRELFARKPLDVLLSETGEQGRHSLKRALGLLDLVALGIGATIGAGIFVITGSAAAEHAGPAIVLSFVLAGVVCMLAGLCYAEFASLIPLAGSAYTYGYATLGEIVAWIIGWDLVLEYAFSTATVAVGWSANVASLLADFGIKLPRPASDFDGVAFLAICGVTAVLVAGVRESAAFNAVMVAFKVSTVMIFLGAAVLFVSRHPETAAANWRPFLPPNSGEFGRFGWSGVARGAAVVFFAYIGFDSVSTAAQEARDPQRTMPRGLLLSLGICTVLYILVSGFLTAIVPYPRLNVAAPVALAMDVTGFGWGSLLVKAGTILGLTTTMLVTLLGQSRVFYSMSRDGLLPPWVGVIHPRFRTPWISSIVVGLFVAVIAALVPIGDLNRLVSIGTLFAFLIVCAGIWILRVREPALPRPFRCPLVPLVPLLGIGSALLLMASLPWTTWLRLIGWLAIGMALYFGYGRRHSRRRTGWP